MTYGQHSQLVLESVQKNGKVCFLEDVFAEHDKVTEDFDVKRICSMFDSGYPLMYRIGEDSDGNVKIVLLDTKRLQDNEVFSPTGISDFNAILDYSIIDIRDGSFGYNAGGGKWDHIQAFPQDKYISAGGRNVDLVQLYLNNNLPVTFAMDPETGEVVPVLMQTYFLALQDYYNNGKDVITMKEQFAELGIYIPTLEEIQVNPNDVFYDWEDVNALEKAGPLYNIHFQLLDDENKLSFESRVPLNEEKVLVFETFLNQK